MDQVGAIAESYHREIAQHARVLAGIVQRYDRLRALNDAIISGTLKVLLAGAGAGLGAKCVALGGKVSVSMVTEALKLGASDMSKSLAGLSGATCIGHFKDTFGFALQEIVNLMTRAIGKRCPTTVDYVAGRLESAFDYNI
jgi:hypothetical protein